MQTMTQYDWRASEPKWQAKWKEWEIHRFDPKSKKEVFSIDNPPRYASGALHLGHAYGYTVIDFAARYKRLKGYNVFFPLCFDVNGMPVEVRVEKVKGIKASEVPRQEFIKMCSEFAEKYIGEMVHQFEILGESMDPSIYYQTDAIYYRRLTQISFIRMFKKGLVYKGHFPINWCPRCGTALAEAEVEYEPRKTKLNYIKFREAESGREVLIATTRPELLCTCLLVAVHPDDSTKQDLVGKELIVPVYNNRVKVVADPKVDPSFGTGTVMICSIGDKDDLEWIMKYNLPLLKGIDESGHMTSIAGKYAGLAVPEAKNAIIHDMKDADLLVKQEDLDQSVGSCWRCHTPIEFLKVPQWFIKSLEYKDQVLKMIDEITWNPEFMKIRIQNWVNSLAWDWVVSRQRYFATAIPVWECKDCGNVLLAEEHECYVDPTAAPPRVAKCEVCGGTYVGSTDVFDTWMDSSISPLYNTFWERDERLFKKLYPMSMRPQGLEIIRTWAYYTILREMLLIGEKPWKETMIHGFIMAPDGTPMHASAGNVIDPMPLVEKYGGDAMRYYAAACALGIDHAFKEQELVRGGRLATKTWNVMRMVGSACKSKPRKPRKMHPIDAWALGKFGELARTVEKHCDKYRFDQATAAIENFMWHEFADHYIELVKHRAYSEKDEGSRYVLYTVGLGVLKLISIILPHMAEDAYQLNFKQFEKPVSIHVSEWPEAPAKDEEADTRGEAVKEVVSAVRSWKSARGISLNAEISRIEIVGPDSERLMGGSESDVKETLKAKELELRPEVALKETVSRLKPVHSKVGPAFRKDAKEIAEAIASAVRPNASVLTQGFEVSMKDGRKLIVGPEYFEAEKSVTSERGELEHFSVSGLSVLVYK
jgi:valyl-tRNA synthetase